MKRVLPFVLTLVIGVGIALAVKANRKTMIIPCCDDFGEICAIVNGDIYLGPPINRPCP